MTASAYPSPIVKEAVIQGNRGPKWRESDSGCSTSRMVKEGKPQYPAMGPGLRALRATRLSFGRLVKKDWGSDQKKALADGPLSPVVVGQVNLGKFTKKYIFG